MHVIHIVHSLRRGGAERVALELAQGMKLRGWASEVVGLTDCNEFGSAFDVEFTGIIEKDEYSWPACLPRLARRLRAHLNERRPDLVEIHSPTASFALAAGGFHRNTVEVFHGYGGYWKAKHDVKALIWRLAHRRVRARLGGAILAVSAELGKYVESAFGLSPGVVVPIYNGVDTNLFRGIPRHDFSRPVICVVGTLASNKRPELALQAFAVLRKRIPGAQLRFFGSGPVLPELIGAARQYGVAENTDFAGTCGNMEEVMARGHLLWHPSLSEGLPLACIEAMSTGMPVIGADVRGVREVVQHGLTGFLVPDAEPGKVCQYSLTLLENPELYAEFSRAARQRAVDTFDRNKMVESHMRVAASVVRPDAKYRQETAGASF